MDNTICEFIEEHIEKTVRFSPVDDGTLIGLPYPYTVPCVSDRFQELFYWDTYFTNIGLLEIGRTELAKNNTDNMLYLVERFGFMPNGSRTFFLNRSQPPYLAQMVRDVYAVTQDAAWLARAYETLKKEYAFWQGKRQLSNGLNGYTNYEVTEKTQEEYDAFVRQFTERTGYCPAGEWTEEVKGELYQAFSSVCEMGWDCNSRVLAEGHYYASLDLNSLLYELEKTMATFATSLDNGEHALWQQRMEARREKFALLWDAQRGLFADYNTKTGSFTPYVGAACFYPLYVELATPEQAESICRLLDKIELPHGISSGEPNSLWNCQWDYPNIWPPMQLMVFRGLRNYGYHDAAMRIARKYVALIEENFQKTGNLWEKYDGNTGAVTGFEYDAPPMMGWTAGVYLYFCRILEQEGEL